MSEIDAVLHEWINICGVDDLNPNSGVCAIVIKEQVAIFYETIGDNLYAVSNYDPVGGANVLSRGILGSNKGRPVIASPLYKQHFDLLTGECLEQPGHCLSVFEVRTHNDSVQIRCS